MQDSLHICGRGSELTSEAKCFAVKPSSLHFRLLIRETPLFSGIPYLHFVLPLKYEA